MTYVYIAVGAVICYGPLVLWLLSIADRPLATLTVRDLLVGLGLFVGPALVLGVLGAIADAHQRFSVVRRDSHTADD